MLTLTLPQPTWAHQRLTAGLKLFVLCCAMVGVMQLSDVSHMLWLLAAVMALYASLGRSSLRPALDGIRPLLIVVAAIMGFHALVSQIQAGVVISLRVFVMVGLANFVTMTTQMSDMIAVAERLAKPFARLGLAPRTLALAMAIFIRYVPVLRLRAEALGLSWRARSNRRMGTRVMVPLVLAALDDADHLADALRARGGTDSIDETNVIGKRDGI